MISTSEIKVSCVIRKDKAQQALRILHKEFGLNKKSRSSK
jgi:aspartate kinase